MNEKLKLISFSSFFLVTLFLSMTFAELFLVNIHKVIAIGNDIHKTSITIIDPPTHNQTIFKNFITINGTTSDSVGSRVNKVEAFVSKIPVNDTASYKLAIPITQGNWSRWSFPVSLNETGSYLVRSRVTDNSGNQDWADVTINLPAHIYNKKIAFVEPTFTYAAYRNGSFYNFYDKYSDTYTAKNNKTITTDLNLLKNRPIPHGPFPYYAHPTYSDIPYISYFDALLQHVKKNRLLPVTKMTDVDVHQGKIFQTDGKNAYDVLFLFHNEYETQSEYNNLKKFVSNGGTIVFTEANILFAEVSYNKVNDSITLVKGHYWKFDGNGATPSVSERWLDENREWAGSNFFDVPNRYKVDFRNNPFNYTHTEEQYVTNPQAKILLNFNAYNLPSKRSNATIATYEMNYGKGKIINLGIWGHTLTKNKAFLNYFDNIIIPVALGPPITLQKASSKIENKDQSTTSDILVTFEAVINYAIPSTLNDIEGQFIPVCRPPSGDTFPIGDTVVKCTATDKAGNNTAIATFIVRVLDSREIISR